MNRKITDLARGLKCGGLAANAFTRCTAPTAGGSSIDASATAPNPWAARTRTSRLVTAVRRCGLLHCQHSLDINKLVPIQQSQAHVWQVPTTREKFLRELLFRIRRLPSQRQIPSGLHRAGAIVLAILAEPLCKSLR